MAGVPLHSGNSNMEKPQSQQQQPERGYLSLSLRHHHPQLYHPSTLLANVILGFGETFPSSTGRMLLASSCLIIR
jgi:hypothetical protein